MMIPISPIVLDQVEQQIFALLRNFVQHDALKVTLRVAGGWVRDKLLGIDCHDLDIALDTMTGEAFASRLHDYLHVRDHHLVSSFGVIQVNPEQSKHLEAATLCILGRPIDFVNMRSENYSQDSRIPDIEIGTPVEDALRRDLTINSLFYNLDTEQVEDLTGHGVEDIQKGIIRTPLEPLVTLTDDPLRLLRAIRFACRFNYRIVPELEQSMLHPQVYSAFMSKVSRERVGIEIDKICAHKNRLLGLALISRIKSVYPMVLGRMPASIEESHVEYGVFVERLRERVLTREGALGLLCLPFTGERYQMVKGSKSKEEAVSMHIMKESLKLGNKDALAVHQLVEHIHELHELNTQLPSGTVANDFITKLGRQIRVIGKDWREAILLAGIYYDVCMQDLEQRVMDLGLENAWEWKPLLSGEDIKALVPGIDPKLIGQWTARILDWQYMHPRGTKEEAIRDLFPPK